MNQFQAWLKPEHYCYKTLDWIKNRLSGIHWVGLNRQSLNSFTSTSQSFLRPSMADCVYQVVPWGGTGGTDGMSVRQLHLCATAPVCSHSSTPADTTATTSDCRAWKTRVFGCARARSFRDKHCEDTLTFNMLAKHVIALLRHWNFHSKLQQKLSALNLCFSSSLFELICKHVKCCIQVKSLFLILTTFFLADLHVLHISKQWEDWIRCI